MNEKDILESLGYRLITLSAKDKARDPLLKKFKYKTLPLASGGTHNYFTSLDEVRDYIAQLKLLR